MHWTSLLVGVLVGVLLVTGWAILLLRATLVRLTEQLWRNAYSVDDNTDAADQLRAAIEDLRPTVEMGGKIRQVSSIMVGVYRPLVDTCTAEDEREIRRGKLKVKDFVEKETIAFHIMKGRKRGEELGETVKLSFKKGRIIDPVDEARSALEERYQI